MPSVSTQDFAPQSVTIIQNGASSGARESAEKSGGFSFGDFIDMINPLHHIPVVGQVYRAITGDKISDTARMAGGGLYAGPLGIGIAATTIALKEDKAASDIKGAPESQGAEPASVIDGPAAQPQSALSQSMANYEKISQGYWTQSNLDALAQSFGLTAPERGQARGQEQDPASAPPTARVADVSDPVELPAPQQQGSAVYSQMLANLQKYEAGQTPSR